jgi:hypothetical protein
LNDCQNSGTHYVFSRSSRHTYLCHKQWHTMKILFRIKINLTWTYKIEFVISLFGYMMKPFWFTIYNWIKVYWSEYSFFDIAVIRDYVFEEYMYMDKWWIVWHVTKGVDDAISEKNVIRRLLCLHKHEIPVLLGCTYPANCAILPVFGMLLSSVIHIFYEPPHKVRKDSVFWAEMCMWSPPYHPNAVLFFKHGRC